MNTRVAFYNLADWGLSVAGLGKLGDRPVRLTAHVRHPREAALFGLPPDSRRDAIRRARSRQYRALAAWWPNPDYEPIGRRQEPSGIQGLLPARLVPRLRSLPVGDVWIESIDGKRRLRSEPQPPEFFAVQARFAIQVERQTRGMQRYEDRIVLVRATTEEDAVARLQKPFATYGRPTSIPGAIWFVGFSRGSSVCTPAMRNVSTLREPRSSVSCDGAACAPSMCGGKSCQPIAGGT